LGTPLSELSYAQSEDRSQATSFSLRLIEGRDVNVSSQAVKESRFNVLAKRVLRYLEGVKYRKISWWCAARFKLPFVPCEIHAYSKFADKLSAAI
jgi:hypothetical protein